MKKSALFVGLIGFSLVLQGQTHHISGAFPVISLGYELNSKWRLDTWSFVSYFPSEKTLDDIIYPAVTGAFYTEVDLTYVIDDVWSLTGSYTYERANPFEDYYRNEHRGWFQVQAATQAGRATIKNRFRYDARFIENRSTGETDYEPRIRHLLGVDRPLGAKVTAIVYNEMFFNTFFEKTAFLAENWAFVGVKFPLHERIQLEPGYLNIAWVRDGTGNWLAQHFAYVGVYYSISG